NLGKTFIATTRSGIFQIIGRNFIHPPQLESLKIRIRISPGHDHREIHPFRKRLCQTETSNPQPTVDQRRKLPTQLQHADPLHGFSQKLSTPQTNVENDWPQTRQNPASRFSIRTENRSSR